MNDWRFAAPPDLATITMRQTIEENESILLVAQDTSDGCWQLLASGAFEEDVVNQDIFGRLAAGNYWPAASSR